MTMTNLTFALLTEGGVGLSPPNTNRGLAASFPVPTLRPLRPKGKFLDLLNITLLLCHEFQYTIASRSHLLIRLLLKREPTALRHKKSFG